MAGAGGESSDRAARDARDAAVMRRLQSGDAIAIGVLYDSYGPVVRGLISKIVRDRAEAEDLTHDAFLTVVKRCDQFQPERGTVASWLIATARNLALDRVRKRNRRAQIAETELRPEPRPPVAGPDEHADEGERSRRIQQALEQLPAAQRETLEAAFFLGLSYPEIAEKDGVPLGTVKSRAARGLSALRSALDDVDPAG